MRLPVRHRSIRDFRIPRWFHSSQQTRCGIPTPLYFSRNCIGFGITPHLMTQAHEFHRALVVARSGGKLLFGTEEHGILGYGPPGIRAGDAVCIVVGATTPFVLRQEDDDLTNGSKQHWHLVGECYAQGIMHGEGLEMGERQSCFLV